MPYVANPLVTCKKGNRAVNCPVSSKARCLKIESDGETLVHLILACRLGFQYCRDFQVRWVIYESGTRLSIFQAQRGQSTTGCGECSSPVAQTRESYLSDGGLRRCPTAQICSGRAQSGCSKPMGLRAFPRLRFRVHIHFSASTSIGIALPLSAVSGIQYRTLQKCPAEAVWYIDHELKGVSANGLRSSSPHARACFALARA